MSACDAPPGFESDLTRGIPEDCINEAMKMVGVPDWKGRLDEQQNNSDFQACMGANSVEQQAERDVMATEMYKTLAQSGVIGKCNSKNFSKAMKFKAEASLGPPVFQVAKVNAGGNVNTDSSEQRGCEPVMMMINQITSNTKRLSCTVKKSGTKLENKTDLRNNITVGNITNCSTNISQEIDLTEAITLTVDESMQKEIDDETRISAVLQNAGSAMVKQQGAAAAPGAKQFQTIMQKFDNDSKSGSLFESVNSAITDTVVNNTLNIGNVDCTLMSGGYNLPGYVTDTQTALIIGATASLFVVAGMYFGGVFAKLGYPKKGPLAGLAVVVIFSGVAIGMMADQSHLQPETAIPYAQQNWSQSIVMEKKLDTSFKSELDESLKTFVTIDSTGTNEATFVGERTQLQVDDVDFSTDPLVQIVMVIAISGAAVAVIGVVIKSQLAKRSNKKQGSTSLLNTAEDRKEAARITAQGDKDRSAVEFAEKVQRQRQESKLAKQLSERRFRKDLKASLQNNTRTE